MPIHSKNMNDMIVIEPEIRLRILQIRGQSVRIGIEAPEELLVQRLVKTVLNLSHTSQPLDRQEESKPNPLEGPERP